MLGLKLIYVSVSIRGLRSWTSSTWFQPFTADPVVGKCQRTHLTGQGESLACARHKALFKINLPLVPHICVSESKQMFCYCQLGLWEQTSVKFESKYNFFHSRKCVWKHSSAKWRPFCPGGDRSRPTSCVVTVYCSQYLPYKILLTATWLKRFMRYSTELEISTVNSKLACFRRERWFRELRIQDSSGWWFSWRRVEVLSRSIYIRPLSELILVKMPDAILLHHITMTS